jgi:adenylate cyclase
MRRFWPTSSKGLRLLSGLALVVVFAALTGWQQSASWLSHLDQKIYDLGLSQQPASMDERIVIVDIDEKSLAEQGRWPWSRKEIATLIENLGAAKVISFDIVFADRVTEDKTSALLEQALKKQAVVLGYYFTSEVDARRTGDLPPAFGPAALAPGVQITHWRGYGANLSQLGRAARAQGFFNPIPDPDGVVRALPLLAEFEGQLYESLALTTLKQYLDVSQMTLRPDELVLKGENNTRTSIALSRGISVLVPYQKGQGAKGGNFKYYSASDVLAGRIARTAFAGKMVLVGSGAPGLTDLRATPVSETYPGVEVHASAIRGILNRELKVRSDFSHQMGLLCVVALGLLLTFGLATQASLGILGLGALALLTQWSVYSLTYTNAQWLIPLAPSLALIFALCLSNLVLGYFTEGRKRAQIVNLFGEYLSPDVVNRLASDPSSSRQQISQTREITVLFCDIRGFTKISEAMDPQILSEYLNEYLTGMTEVIHQSAGTVDKYIGDAVMAFWGAPMTDSHHATHAVSAAIKMQTVANALSQSFVSRGLPPLSVGIGIHTGQARVGDMGSKLRRVYTAIGDTVNLASRLESLTKSFDTPVIVSEATARAAPKHDFTELDSVLVQGRAEPVLVFAPTQSMLPKNTLWRDRRPVQLSLVAG